ncbi:MAG: acyl-CoA thioesterase [Candidatus Hydrogenedentes bacterium]|nr:acyl-CoA thioesterase [Candidatus Hydrogenedentota bacterium]
MREAQPGKRPLLVTLRHNVQTYDIDFANHVNNQVYVRWLEDLRMELLRQYYPIKRFMDEGVAPILASTHITYKKGITLYDEPTGFMWCTKLGRATMNLECNIQIGETLCAHATHRVMLMNLESGRPSRTPQELFDAFDAGNA